MSLKKEWATPLLVFLSLLGSPAQSDPRISDISVENRLGMGPVLVVSGNGFTEKSQASPLYWNDFEQSPQSDLEISRLSKDVDVTGDVVDSGAQGIDNVLQFQITDSHSMAFSKLNFSSDQLYVFLNRKYSFSISDPATWGSRGFNLKVNRLWAGFSKDLKNNIYLGYQGKEGRGSSRIFTEYTADGGATWVKGIPQRENEWLQEEIIYQTSDIDDDNGLFRYMRGGNVTYDKMFKMRTKDFPNRYGILVFDQISNGTGEGPLYISYDNVYVDDTLHRVLISDSPVLPEATNRMIQIPIKWTDGQLELLFKEPQFGGKRLYLYVFDRQGNANAEGFPFCMECPEPPSGITME